MKLPSLHGSRPSRTPPHALSLIMPSSTCLMTWCPSQYSNTARSHMGSKASQHCVKPIVLILLHLTRWLRLPLVYQDQVHSSMAMNGACMPGWAHSLWSWQTGHYSFDAQIKAAFEGYSPSKAAPCAMPICTATSYRHGP